MRPGVAARRCFLGFVAGGIVLFSGCLPLSSSRPEPLDAERDHVVVEESRRTVAGGPSWEEGMEAFRAGEYQRAAHLFEALLERAQGDEARRMGLYAVACSRLVAARTPREFQEAIALWEQWRQAVPPGLRYEDPRMMAPLIRRIPPPSKPGPRPAERARGEASPEVKRLMQSKEDEIRAQEELVRAKEEEIRSKEEEVRELREQLEALEAIHRNIGEKKRGVSAP
jgi:hypothetical protein